jgi:hypothetical protein
MSAVFPIEPLEPRQPPPTPTAAPPYSHPVTYLIAALPLLLAVALYGYALRLPFFLDDGPHLAALAQTDGLRHWGDFPAFPFYRPFVFSVWKGFEALTGGYDPVALHLLNVFCFGLAGVLAGEIARRIAPARTRWVGVLAGCAFVIFPFSYQAVAMVAALFHLTLALGIGLSLWAALLWLGGRAGSWALLLSWLAAFCAVFSHENGVLLPALLLGLLAAAPRRYRAKPRRIVLVIAPVMLIAVVYALLWWRLRPQAETALTETFTVSLAALLQGLIYPLAALLRPLVSGDVAPGVLLALVAAAIIPALLLAWRRSPRWLALMVYGLGWYLLAVLPAVLLLPGGYVLGQPRLALLASVGAGIFWAGVLLALFRRWPRLALIPTLLFAYVSIEFLEMRRADFLRLSEYNRQVLAIFEAHNAAQTGALLVNAPGYLTPDEADRRFLLGTEGVLFVDETLDYNQQFWMNADEEYGEIEVIAYPAIQRNTGYGFRAHPPALDGPPLLERVWAAPLVVVTGFHEDEFYPALVGGSALTGPAAPAGGDSGALYPETGFSLLAASAVFRPQPPTVTVTARWQVDDPAPVKVFVHVYCKEDFIAQSDGYPWGDTYPFAAWNPGETHTDIRHIRLDEPIDTADCLQVYAGLYREEDVTRLMALDPGGGERYPDDRYPVPLQTGGAP